MECFKCGSRNSGIAVDLSEGITAHLMNENSQDVEHTNASMRMLACRDCGFVNYAYLNVAKGKPVPLTKKQPE